MKKNDQTFGVLPSFFMFITQAIIKRNNGLLKVEQKTTIK